MPAYSTDLMHGGAIATKIPLDGIGLGTAAAGDSGSEEVARVAVETRRAARDRRKAVGGSRSPWDVFKSGLDPDQQLSGVVTFMLWRSLACFGGRRGAAAALASPRRVGGT